MSPDLKSKFGQGGRASAECPSTLYIYIHPLGDRRWEQLRALGAVGT